MVREFGDKIFHVYKELGGRTDITLWFSHLSSRCRYTDHLGTKLVMSRTNTVLLLNNPHIAQNIDEHNKTIILLYGNRDIQETKVNIK